ncbi:MAG: recombinase RecA [Candidatus Gribaldobacteria bacterium]|nr:recombinase RecA [Candidatus Gribaldobacteria bacterium]
MPKKKKESKKITNLEDALAEIKQRFGEGAIMQLSSMRAVNVDAISTGAVSLDLALGVGGVPRGRIIEIFGGESSGKTTMALHIVAETQKKGGTVAFVDAEHAMDPEYAGKIGVNMKDLLISQPDSGEQALQIVETLVMSGSVDLIVIDSVAALTPKAEIEGEIGDQHIGRQARLMSQALRKLTSVAANTNTTLIFLNQIRMKIGVFFGNPETTPGGLALKFYASVRIELRRIAQIKKGEQIIGSRIRAKIVKNKVAAPFRTAELDIYWNEGISKSIDLVNAGLRYDILKKVGTQLQYQDKKFGQSPDAARTFFEAEKKLATDLRKEIIEKAKEVIK